MACLPQVTYPYLHAGKTLSCDLVIRTSSQPDKEDSLLSVQLITYPIVFQKGSLSYENGDH